MSASRITHHGPGRLFNNRISFQAGPAALDQMVWFLRQGLGLGLSRRLEL